MRFVTILLVLSALFAAFAQTAGAAERVRYFLNTVEAGTLPIDANGKDFPLVAAGALANNNAPLIPALAQGKSILVAPRGGTALAFQLVSPVLNSGEFWEPVALVRVGDTLILQVESWTDDWDRAKNVRHRRAYVVAAHVADPGRYTLRVEVADLFNASADGNRHYVRRKLLAASVAVTIGPANHGGEQEPPPPVRAADLKQVPELATAPSPWRQRVNDPASFKLSANQNAMPFPLAAGAFDLAAYREAKEPRPFPVLAPPDATDRVYARVAGPVLQSYEQMTLGRVTWEDANRCTVHVDVWTDSGGRDKNVPFTPVLFVPLEPAKRVRNGWPTGEYTVTLDFNRLRAPQPQGAYAAAAADQLAKPKPIQVAFTIK